VQPDARKDPGAVVVDRVATSHLHEDEDENAGNDATSVSWTAELAKLCNKTFADYLHSLFFDLMDDGGDFLLEIRMINQDVPQFCQDPGGFITAFGASCPSM